MPFNVVPEHFVYFACVSIKKIVLDHKIPCRITYGWKTYTYVSLKKQLNCFLWCIYTKTSHFPRIVVSHHFFLMIFFQGAKHLDTVNASCWKKYVERCIKICWFMSIQYPPMMLYFGAKEYSNPLAVKYEYTVQPAISLYESGPLLLKGVTSSGSSLIC